MSRTAYGQVATPFTNHWSLSYKGKTSFGVLFPLAASTGAGVFFWLLPSNILGDRGLVDATLPLLSLLVGFYVAALGLVLTADHKFLDTIPDNPPRRRGDDLTLRSFLVDIFSFLVALAIVTHVVGVVALVSAPALLRVREALAAVPDLDVDATWRALRGVAGATYVLMLTKLLVTTLVSLFFVAHRFQEMRDEEVEPADPAGWQELSERADDAANGHPQRPPAA